MTKGCGKLNISNELVCERLAGHTSKHKAWNRFGAGYVFWGNEDKNNNCEKASCGSSHKACQAKACSSLIFNQCYVLYDPVKADSKFFNSLQELFNIIAALVCLPEGTCSDKPVETIKKISREEGAQAVMDLACAVHWGPTETYKARKNFLKTFGWQEIRLGVFWSSAHDICYAMDGAMVCYAMDDAVKWQMRTFLDSLLK